MKNFKLTDLDIIRVGWIVSRMKIYHHTGARIIGLWIDPVNGLYQVVYRAKENLLDGSIEIQRNASSGNEAVQCTV